MADQNNEENEYRQATKVVVDDAMRTDVLGPNVCKVLKEHLPSHELLEEKITKLINESPKVKAALATQISDNQTVRTGKWIERVVLVVGGAAVTWLGQLIIGKLTS